MEARDARDDLLNDIVMLLISNGMHAYDAENSATLLLKDYEITSRCTEIAVTGEARNEYLVKRFLIAKSVKGCTERTLGYYANTLKHVLSAMGKSADDITADDVRLYIAMRAKRDGVSDRTVGNEVRVLRSFFAWCNLEEILGKNIMLKIGTIKERRVKHTALTDEEVEKLRYAIKDDLRMTAVMELLLSTGCRISELVNIRLDEIDDDRILVHGKGKKDRYVYMNVKARVSMERYIEKRNDGNPYLFPGSVLSDPVVDPSESDITKIAKISKKGRSNMKDWWQYPEFVSGAEHIEKEVFAEKFRKYAKKAGVERANPHKFRHTCATMALRRGMPIEQVSKMLGHENVGTTQIYLDLTEEDLKMAHKKYVV